MTSARVSRARSRSGGFASSVLPFAVFTGCCLRAAHDSQSCEYFRAFVNASRSARTLPIRVLGARDFSP